MITNRRVEKINDWKKARKAKDLTTLAGFISNFLLSLTGFRGFDRHLA
jgi:hypothetical protein